MTNPSLIIIGAGIAGLSAGCYAQMNGLARSQRKASRFDISRQPHIMMRNT